MDVAGLVLGIIGTMLAAGSAGWNVAQYLLSGSRPKLTPIIGTDYGGGALPIDATADVRPVLLALEAQLEADPADRIVGVTVVNKGRADLRVTRWSFRGLPAGTVFLPPALHRVRLVAAASEGVGGGRPQRVVATVTSSGRTRTSKPFFMPMLTEGTP